MITSIRLWLARKLAPEEFERLRDYDLNPPVARFPPLGSFDTSAVAGELGRAMKKRPAWPTDPMHAVAVVNAAAGELNRAVEQQTYDPEKAGDAVVRVAAIRLVAVAIRFLASFWRYGFAECAQHQQEEQP